MIKQLKSLNKKPKKEFLMRKQIERCYCCGKIGHKARRWLNVIVQLHCVIGCDANSGFYGKGTSSVYDKGSKEPTRCGDSLDVMYKILEDLFKFTRHVIYGDTKLRPTQQSGG